METFWWKIVGEKYLVENIQWKLVGGKYLEMGGDQLTQGSSWLLGTSWLGETSWLGVDQIFIKADRGSDACIYHQTFNMADRVSYAFIYGDKINGDINQPTNKQPPTIKYRAICLCLEDGQADICNHHNHHNSMWNAVDLGAGPLGSRPATASV